MARRMELYPARKSVLAFRVSQQDNPQPRRRPSPQETAQKRGFGEYSCALSELDECIPSDVSVEKQFEAAQLAEMIEKWLDSLPREKRAVFILRYFYLKPVAEVASDLDITISKTAAILRRERISLQKTLEKEGVL